jgi:RimJ/RimL family protein N-acetyltransferase
MSSNRSKVADILKTKRLQLEAPSIMHFEVRKKALLTLLRKTRRFEIKISRKGIMDRILYEKKVDRIKQRAAISRSFVYFIFLNGKFIGEANINGIKTDDFREAELGIWLFKKYEGFGYAMESIQRIIQFCMEDLKLSRVEMIIHEENKSSFQLAKNCNFRIEGFSLRRIQERGKWYNTFVFAITIDEYKRLKKLELV